MSTKQRHPEAVIGPVSHVCNVCQTLKVNDYFGKVTPRVEGTAGTRLRAPKYVCNTTLLGTYEASKLMSEVA